MARIFLCHANEDKPQVEKLYDRLRALGFEAWMDKRDLIPGQRWQREIPLALKASALVLVCLSRNIGRPGYIQREFKLAVDALQEIPEEMIHTIPVRLDLCNVPEQFTSLHWCNLFEPNGFDVLVSAIRYGLAQRGFSVPDVSSMPEPFSTFTNTIGMEFILIPAGTFMMGTPKEQLDAIAGDDQDYRNRIENETPQHQVEISRPFYLGKYPITQRQWERVMGSNPSVFKGDNLPVHTVSWNDVQAFMEKLNDRAGVDLYRLPTEAEWEYACRAESNTIYYFGDDEIELGEYAWYGEGLNGQTHPVGQKNPNAWGLYDMHGNVWEWVQDRYDENYYLNSPHVDPQGPDATADRVLRGGDWAFKANNARSAFRAWVGPGESAVVFGFRCAMSVPRK